GEHRRARSRGTARVRGARGDGAHLAAEQGAVGMDDRGGPQVHRGPLRRHGVPVLSAGRHRGHADAHSAGPPGEPAAGSGPVQPDLQHARHHHDVPVRCARAAGRGALLRSADGGHAQHCFSPAERAGLLDVPGGRASAVLRIHPEHRARRRVVQLRAAGRARILARQAHRRVGADGDLHRDRGADRRGRDHRHRVQAARAGNVAQPHSAVRLVRPGHLVRRAVRHALRGPGQHDAGLRPAGGHPLLQPGRGRRPAALAAPVLVLRASRSLHHVHPGNRVRVRDHPRVRAAQDVRAHGAGAGAGGHGVPELRAVGAPHVHHRPSAAGAELLHGRQPDDRHPQRRADLLLARDALGGAAAPADAAAVRHRLHHRLHDGRDHRRDGGLGAVRPAGARHLLHRRPPSLRAAGRVRVPALRGLLLLVPQGHRADDVGDAGEMAVLALLHRRERHLLSHALPGADGHDT
ncbi:MAG: Cytochrome c oxidase polypeptide I, partial [uncultured Gemmatimonadetes bacterium]